MLKWGILGCGKIAKSFAADLALLPKGHVLQAVASRSEPKAALFAEEVGAATWYGSYLELCEDAAVDIIYVATPHSSHMEYGIMVMEHGKHLLCEKALAVNSSQVQQMIATAQRQGVFFMEAMWARFNPSIVQAKQLVDSGYIGEVSYIHADFCFQKDFDPSSRLFDPVLAGGALLDVGVYPLFLSYLILGRAEQLQAHSLLHDNGVDLQTSILLQYGEAHSILSCGFLNTPHMEARINGRHGSIHLHPRWHEAQGYSTYIDKHTVSHSLPTLGAGYTGEIMECARCIANDSLQSDLWSHEDSLALMEMCDEVRKQCGISYPFEQVK